MAEPVLRDGSGLGHGHRVTRLREMIYAYPTFHRAVQDALRAADSARQEA